MARSTLSVIVPNYNHANFLRTAVAAIVQQSYRPYEVIIVDDGSQDNSIQVAQQIMQDHPIVRLVLNGRNRGVAYTHNHGLALARAEYVYFAGADDQVLPGFFEQALAMAEAHPPAGIIFAKFAKVDFNGRVLAAFEASHWHQKTFAEPDRFLREYLQLESPSHSMCAATVYRRAHLVEVGGFRKELGHWADTFAARAIALKHGACYVPEVFMHWRFAADSVAHSTSTAHLIRIASLAAQLMRSPEFRDRFPEWYVQSWLQGYCDAVINRHVVQTEKQIQAINRDRRDRLMMPLHRMKAKVVKVVPFINWIKFGKVLDPMIRYIGDIWCTIRLRYTEWTLRRNQESS